MRAASARQQQLQFNNPPPVVTPVPEEDVAEIVETGNPGWADLAGGAGGDGAGWATRGGGAVSDAAVDGVERFTAAARRKAEMMLRRQSTLSGRGRKTKDHLCIIRDNDMYSEWDTYMVNIRQEPIVTKTNDFLLKKVLLGTKNLLMWKLKI